MVLARGGLFREGAEGKDRYPRTQQASQNATRGHHTQRRGRERAIAVGPGVILRNRQTRVASPDASASTDASASLVESLILAQDQRWRRA
jgi:hypothetical protein